MQVLNIISNIPGSGKYIGGPNKVFYNTIKGLEKIGQCYVLNKDIRQYQWNWIQDSIQGLIEIALKQIPAVVGPNIAVLPRDLPILLPSLKNITFLHPSVWPIESWRKAGFNKCELISWPTGIDTGEFRSGSEIRNAENILIYFKKRDPELLIKSIDIVKSKGFNPIVIKYGGYTEDEYKAALRLCSFGIWIGISESQGIGLLEAFAAGIPLIIMDVSSLYESFDNKRYIFPSNLRIDKLSSAPYFSSKCGIKIYKIEELDEAISYMKFNLAEYNPSEFINNELSLEKQAKELINIFEKIDHSKNLKIQRTYPLQQENKDLDFSLSIRGRFLYSLYRIRRKLMNEYRKIKFNSSNN